jgi:hypothetical protein
MCNTPIYFYNISIYFCNVDIKHLQHTSKISETLEIYVCKILFQRKHLLTASAKGGSLACGGHRCARQQHRAMGDGAYRAGVGAAWAVVWNLSYILSFVAEIKVFVAFPSVFVDRPVPFIFLVLVLKLVGLRLPITVVLAACFHSIDKKNICKNNTISSFHLPSFFHSKFCEAKFN